MAAAQAGPGTDGADHRRRRRRRALVRPGGVLTLRPSLRLRPVRQSPPTARMLPASSCPGRSPSGSTARPTRWKTPWRSPATCRRPTGSRSTTTPTCPSMRISSRNEADRQEGHRARAQSSGLARHHTGQRRPRPDHRDDAGRGGGAAPKAGRGDALPGALSAAARPARQSDAVPVHRRRGRRDEAERMGARELLARRRRQGRRPGGGRRAGPARGAAARAGKRPAALRTILNNLETALAELD